MGIFSKKNEEYPKDTDIDGQLTKQATRLGLSLAELKNLSVGKSCPKYGTAELLHARKVSDFLHPVPLNFLNPVPVDFHDCVPLDFHRVVPRQK